MAVYSIRDLEIITGIKTHTIRIWERRYNLIEPKRTKTNIRYYSDKDLKKLLNISILNKKGMRISQIASMDESQIRDRVLDCLMDSKQGNITSGNLMVAMLELDELRFTTTLSESIIKIGFEATIETILFPFLDRVTLLWQAGAINVSQDHYISNLIRQKLLIAINNEIRSPESTHGRILFFTPENEWHEITLLFYSFVARKAGFETIYLGASTPLNEIGNMLDLKPFDAIFFSMVFTRSESEIDKTIDQIAQLENCKKVFITGNVIEEYNPAMPDNFTLCTSATQFKKELQKLPSAGIDD